MFACILKVMSSNPDRVVQLTSAFLFGGPYVCCQKGQSSCFVKRSPQMAFHFCRQGQSNIGKHKAV
uniref:Uncharacterized protein n=1 Tax=Arion vulgaris TaxID=1028688 RepID=A0A0B7A3V4_9EUPU